MPKSASTSFATAIAELSGKTFTQEVQLRKKYGMARGFDALAHSDIAPIPIDHLKKWVNSDVVYKQHLAPSVNNLENIISLNSKVLVLTRLPKDIISSYERVPNSGNKILWNSKKFSKKDSLKQLVKFKSGYEKLRGNSNFLFISYEDIVFNHIITLKRAFNFLGLKTKVSKDYSLPKKRYFR